MPIFRLIPEGDLALEQGDVVWVDGLRHRRQQISTRFRFFRGEWFLNLGVGIPYFEEIFVKDPNLDVCRTIFRGALFGSPGVLSVPTFDLVADDVRRILGFRFVAVTDAGVLTVATIDRDFTIQF